MTRENGTNFNFYRRVSATDPWEAQPMGTLVHAALTNGLPLQVGLCEAMFTGALGTAGFDSFMLDATNIAGGAPPSAASGLTLALNPDNVSMNLTWAPGTNSDGSQATSMVILRAGAPVSEQPYFGFLSTADARFGFGTDLGSGNYVVYRAVGTNVTVTGLTPGTVYYAAVYSYSGSGSTKVFNQQTLAVGSLAAGTLAGITTTLPGNGIPMGGIGLPVVHALYSGGGGGDISSLATLVSSDPNVIVANNGVLTGLTNGSATITATYQNFTNTFVARVRPPGFTDDFAVSHDYLAGGVGGTAWDGVYEHPGDIPGTAFVSDPLAAVSVADANISSNGVLTVTSENVGWEFGQNDGFFLFKYVPGDFQAAVHLNSFERHRLRQPRSHGPRLRDRRPRRCGDGFRQWDQRSLGLLDPLRRVRHRHLRPPDPPGQQHHPEHAAGSWGRQLLAPHRQAEWDQFLVLPEAQRDRPMDAVSRRNDLFGGAFRGRAHAGRPLGGRIRQRRQCDRAV